MTAQIKIKQALAHLIAANPFWAYLALRLEIVEDATCDTAWVDGRSLGYNPEFVLGLTNPQVRGLICHEIMHVAMGHCWRRQGRDQKKWNVACDYAINPVVLEAGFELPEGGLWDDAYRGLSAEAIYGRLPVPPPQDEPTAGDEPQPPAAGEVRDAKPDP